MSINNNTCVKENSNSNVFNVEILSSILESHISALEKKFEDRFSKFEENVNQNLQLINDKIDKLYNALNIHTDTGEINIKIVDLKKTHSKKKAHSSDAIISKKISTDNTTLKKSRKSGNLRQLESLLKNFPKDSLEKNATILQRFVRGFIERDKLLSEKNERRNGIINEIYETEKNYIETLNTIKKHFMDPLLEKINSNSSIISKHEYRVIFGEVLTILGINNVIFGLIEPRVKNWNNRSVIGDIFINIADSLKIYTKYFDGYTYAIELLKNKLSSSKAFATFIKNAESHPDCKMQDIMMMLLTPIQRIFRYEIMLSALLEATSKDHPDYSNIEKAIKKLIQVSEFVNQKKKESEGARKLMEIQAVLVNSDISIVKENRMYITDIVVDELLEQTFKLFLFSDSILFTIPCNNNLLSFQQFCGLEGCQIKRLQDYISVRTPSRRYSFKYKDENVLKFFDAVESTIAFFNKKLKSSSTVNIRTMFNEIAYDNRASTVSKSASLNKARPVMDLKTTFKIDSKKEKELNDSEDLIKKSKEFKKSRPKSWHEKLHSPLKRIQNKE